MPVSVLSVVVLLRILIAHPAIDWRVSWDDPASDAGLVLQQVLAEKQERHGYQPCCKS